LPGGREVVRQAYFYPPDSPHTLAIPPLADSLASRAGCTLGAMTVEADEPQLGRGRLAADSARAAISRAIGAELPRPSKSPIDNPNFSSRGIWRTARMSVISAFDSVRSQTELGAELPPKLIAIAVISGGPADPERPDDSEVASASASEAVWLDSAIAIAALGDSANAAVRALITPDGSSTAQQEGGSALDSLQRDSLRVATVELWTRAAKRLDPRRQAAAFFVADRVVQGAVPWIQQGERSMSDSLALLRLRAAGAHYQYNEPDAGYTYTLNLLEESRRVLPTGALADAAFLLLLDRAFPSAGTCRSDEFREVIAEGERFLKGTHDRVTTLAVERAVADAYRDIVSLAGGSGSEWANPSDYARESAPARRLALDHYHAVLALDSTSAASRDAWREAWRLAAGLPTVRLRFFCVND
jgi:hypothetical protein